MDELNDYKIADINEQEILKINETQDILRSVYDKDIVLIAYSKK